jgi:LPS sulfotransferase NodH
MARRAKDWGLANRAGTYNFRDYLHAVRKHTCSANGVLGLRIMWGTLDEMLIELANMSSVPADNHLELLEHAFGRLEFIYLYRADLVSQSISLLRAEQTNYWHSTQDQTSGSEPDYTFDGILSRVELLQSHNEAWRDWFQNVGVTPLEITYEELDLNPESVTRQVLNYLDLDLPSNVALSAPNQRLADDMTQSWKQRFMKELRIAE